MRKYIIAMETIEVKDVFTELKSIIENVFVNKNIKVKFSINSNVENVNIDFKVMKYFCMMLQESLYDEGYCNFNFNIIFEFDKVLYIIFKITINDCEGNDLKVSIQDLI